MFKTFPIAGDPTEACAAPCAARLDAGQRRVGFRKLHAALAALPILVAAATVGSASAADLPINAPASVPMFTWAGFYFGLNAGVGFAGNSNLHYASFGRSAGAYDLYPGIPAVVPGATIGGQVGYNWQFGNLVVGVETDYAFLGDRPVRNATFAAPPAYQAAGVGAYLISGGRTNYFGTLRGRVGYAFDRTLLYATGGIAYGGSRDAAAVTLGTGGGALSYPAGVSTSSQTKYAVGGGLEYALGDNWTARFEYLFVNLSRNQQVFDNGSGAGYVLHLTNANHIVRAGLNYKLDAPAQAAPAADGQDGDKPSDAPERWSVHGQITEIPQYHPGFFARYSGANSLSPNSEIKETFSATAFLGLRLWKGGEIYLNPEIDQGFGVSNSFGVAGFPNNEAFKVGSAAPYERTQRYFFRQVVGLGGETEQIASGQNQLADPVDSNRLTFTVGKYAVTDIFDDNKYAHDSRNGFLNWTINSMGAFDYAADAWGYTNGATAEWKQDRWTARVGIFQLSQIPNGEKIEPVPLRQFQPVVELEERHAIAEQPGKLKALFYASDGYMGSFNQAVAQAAGTGVAPDVTTTRARRVKIGGGLNLEQQITPSLGLFARLSMSSGQYETFEFTEVERSATTGVVLSGDLWGRDKDQIGVGGVINGISAAHARYLGAGGLGLLLGDGALSYSGERILETYYKLGIAEGVNVTANYQFVDNPGYNRDRGPVSLFALRLHAEF